MAEAIDAELNDCMSASAPPNAIQDAAGRESPSLASAFQELLTVLVRLRAGRQPVSSADLFRSQIRQALMEADQSAKNLGHSGADIRSAAFAYVAFLDESILNLRNPVFGDWVRKPMQEELFGRHTAGEIFFDQLKEIMSRPDTPACADLLEVYCLCLRLGFLGRYSVTGRGEARQWADQAEEKIQRIRRTAAGLSPQALPPPAGAVVVGATPWWVRASLVSAAAAVVLFLAYTALLKLAVEGLRGV